MYSIMYRDKGFKNKLKKPELIKCASIIDLQDMYEHLIDNHDVKLYAKGVRKEKDDILINADNIISIVNNKGEDLIVISSNDNNLKIDHVNASSVFLTSMKDNDFYVESSLFINIVEKISRLNDFDDFIEFFKLSFENSIENKTIKIKVLKSW